MPKMTKDQIRARVITVISENLGERPEKILDETHLVEDLGADSLDTVELVMALEEEFDLEITDEEAEAMLSVRSIVDYVESHQG